MYVMHVGIVALEILLTLVGKYEPSVEILELLLMLLGQCCFSKLQILMFVLLNTNIGFVSCY